MTPPCKWTASADLPECGEPATHKVRVRTPTTTAVVDLCDKHKKKHDEKSARLRTTSR